MNTKKPFKTPPPYKVTGIGTMVIAGVTYHDTDSQAKADQVPDATISRIAHWTVANIPDNGTKANPGLGNLAARTWLNPNLRHFTSKLDVLAEYIHDVWEYGTGDANTPAQPIPGPKDPGGVIGGTIGAFTSISDAVVGLINALFDPNFWRRALEFGIGAILVGIGLAHLTDVGPTLRSVPLYGKMIPNV